MRLALTLPLLAALALPLTGCFDRDDHKKGRGHCGNNDEAAPANVVNLTRSRWYWIGSASGSAAQVFRQQPEPQRGQLSYVFVADGSYAFSGLSCTAPATINGTWALKGQTLTLYPTGGAAEVRQIVSISATELQLAR